MTVDPPFAGLPAVSDNLKAETLSNSRFTETRAGAFVHANGLQGALKNAGVVHSAGESSWRSVPRRDDAFWILAARRKLEAIVVGGDHTMQMLPFRGEEGLTRA